MKAIWKGTILAESETVEEVEGNIYFPPESVKKEYLKNSPTTYTCPWKGDAIYFSIQVGDDEYKDGAWSYPEPKEAAKQIKEHVAFDKEVEIVKD